MKAEILPIITDIDLSPDCKIHCDNSENCDQLIANLESSLSNNSTESQTYIKISCDGPARVKKNNFLCQIITETKIDVARYIRARNLALEDIIEEI